MSYREKKKEKNKKKIRAGSIYQFLIGFWDLGLHSKVEADLNKSFQSTKKVTEKTYKKHIHVRVIHNKIKNVHLENTILMQAS